ncbi:MAG: acyl-CoA thioesterase, partial [Planctomycetales bacterium 12-60-4]
AGMLSPEWHVLPSDSPLAKNFEARMGSLWEADEPGSRLTFRFRGSTAKVYDLLGPDGGQVVITVDGQTRDKPAPRFDSYCTYHRIATLTVANGLDPAAVHTVTIEIHPDQPDRQSVAFRLKDPVAELQSPKYQGTKVRASQLLILGDVVTE